MASTTKFLSLAACLSLLSSGAIGESIGSHSYGAACGQNARTDSGAVVYRANCGSDIVQTFGEGTVPAFGADPMASVSPFEGSTSITGSPSAFFLSNRMSLSPAAAQKMDGGIGLNAKSAGDVGDDSRGSEATIMNSVIPEPGSLALFGTGLVALAGLLRRKKPANS